MIDILLIQPPALKPAEPPLALAVLLAHLRDKDIVCHAIDANLEAYLYLLDKAPQVAANNNQSDTNLQRAIKHRDTSLELLQGGSGSDNFGRYNTAVRYLNRLLAVWNSSAEKLTLGDYQHNTLSPFVPDDLKLLVAGQENTLFHTYFIEELLPQIKALQPRIIGLSINYLHQALPAFELAGILKRECPQIQLVAGGGLITSWKETLGQLNLELPPFDKLIFGPAEAALTALAKGTITTATISDPSTITFVPDFSFANIAAYLSPQAILPLTASRGCYWRQCLFCPEAASPVHPYCSFPQADLPKEMQRLAHEHKVNYIQLTDNAVPVNMLKSLVENQQQLEGIHWFGFVRFEKALEDLDFVKKLAKSGCRMLQLGLESGSQEVLERLQKGIKLTSVEKILANLAATGIATFVYIMLGTPGETEEDAELTLKFLETHADQIGFLNISIMNMPRASGLLDRPEQYGICDTESVANDTPLALYQRFNSTSAWNRATARRFLNQRLLGSPSIRAIVNRTPPLFTSNHAVFFAGDVVQQKK